MSRVDGTLALVCHYLNDLRAFSGDDISRLTMSDRSSRQRRICQQGGKQQEQVQDRKPEEAARGGGVAIILAGVQPHRQNE
jgi:hypothetical protein